MNENERLFINDVEIDLKNNSTAFARTLQVNDLVNIENRQTSYTKNIEVPKTPKNLKTFGFLGVEGNQSVFPYQKNTAKYLIGNEYVIYDGWVIVNQTDNNYNLTIYDGAIDLYKAIENKTLADLDISSLNHEKTFTNLINSFTSTTTDYKYIIADYNGNCMYSGDTINTDYLVPSTKISFLFDKIFEFAGATYAGDVFNSNDFNDTYISYLKKNDGASINLINYQDLGYNVATGSALASNKLVIKYNAISATTSTGGHFSSDGESFIVDAGGVYEINTNGFIVADVWSGGMYYADQFLTVGVLVNDLYDFPITNTLSGSTQVVLNAGDSIKLYATTFPNSTINPPLRFGTDFGDFGFVWWFWAQYKYVSSSNETATQALSEFSLKDFLNEILWKYGLTMYKDKYKNHYTFKNLSEVINPTNNIDYSDKYLSTTSEKYLYGNYCQLNRLAHKYNTQNVSYNDGFLSIENKNLTAEKTVITSKIYAQELTPSNNLPFETSVYKYWDKEIKDDGTIDYKDLSSRFYFLKEKEVSFPSGQKVGSESLVGASSATTFYNLPVERNDGISFKSSVSNYYGQFNKVLNSSKLLICDLWLDYEDIVDFDFSRLYYFKQLGSYFLVNKIINFQMNKSTSVELIQIDNPLTPVESPFNIDTSKAQVSVRKYRFSPESDLTYAVRISVKILDTYTDFISSATTTTLNGDTEAFYGGSYTYPEENEYGIDTATLNDIGGGIDVEDVLMTFKSGSNIKEIRLANSLSFTPTEVTEEITKEVQLNITYIS